MRPHRGLPPKLIPGAKAWLMPADANPSAITANGLWIKSGSRVLATYASHNIRSPVIREINGGLKGRNNGVVPDTKFRKYGGRYYFIELSKNKRQNQHQQRVRTLLAVIFSAGFLALSSGDLEKKAPQSHR